MKPRPMRLLMAESSYSTGTETVSLGIVPELMRLVECVVWAMPTYRRDFYQKSIPASDRLIYEELFWPRESRYSWRVSGILQRMESFLPRSRMIAWMQLRLHQSWLKHLIRKHRITHFFTTWIFNVECPRLPVPIGAMAMDLNWHQFPENFPTSDRESLDRSFGKWLATADVVFPISDFTAQELKRAFPRAAKRVRVVPHGARALLPSTTGAAAPPGDENPTRPYFYYPASALAHKGHLTAIDAALKLFALGLDFDLVFSGALTDLLRAKTWESNPLTESLRALLEKNAERVQGRIKCLGIVERARVEALVAGARAIVLPSRFEGFGLPLLEAIERGARVICTDIPPFMEQIRRYDYAEFTRLFPVGAAPDLADLMKEALQSPMKSRPTADEINARTQRWTWKDAAAAYVDALQQA